MSDIIPILVFLVIAGVSVYRNHVKRQQEYSRRTPSRPGAEPDLPEMERKETGMDMPGDVGRRTMPLTGDCQLNEGRRRGKGRTEVEKLSREQKRRPVRSAGKIRLDSPSDARRAFIYSEIFNRKYD